MRSILLACALVLAAILLPALTRAETPGLTGARLLPGWIAVDGRRMAAVELTLAPGWKTYWRAPGDSGIAPAFTWQGAASAEPLWPAPEVIDSDGVRTLGYHHRLLLPVALTGAPGPISVHVTFGLCERVCVPAEVTLDAPAPDTAPDPAIEAALARVPALSPVRPTCTLADIADGVRVTARLPHDGAVPQAAIELPGSWVSAAEVSSEGGTLTATADLVPPQAKPFAPDLTALRMTLIGPDGASETLGCAS